jgi:hypothetical protein
VTLGRNKDRQALKFDFQDLWRREKENKATANYEEGIS